MGNGAKRFCPRGEAESGAVAHPTGTAKRSQRTSSLASTGKTGEYRDKSHTEACMVARMRHIALLVTDPEKSAQFFEQAFGMKRAGLAGRGLYMSDGTINIALLKVDPEKEQPGLYHFGMWVDDLE